MTSRSQKNIQVVQVLAFIIIRAPVRVDSVSTKAKTAIAELKAIFAPGMKHKQIGLNYVFLTSWISVNSSMKGVLAACYVPEFNIVSTASF